jgi:hypothetical protein
VVPAKLQRHLHTKHVDSKHQLNAFLKRKCDELKHSETSLTAVVKGENVNVCEA